MSNQFILLLLDSGILNILDDLLLGSRLVQNKSLIADQLEVFLEFNFVNVFTFIFIAGVHGFLLLFCDFSLCSLYIVQLKKHPFCKVDELIFFELAIFVLIKVLELLHSLSGGYLYHNFFLLDGSSSNTFPFI